MVVFNKRSKLINILIEKNTTILIQYYEPNIKKKQKKVFKKKTIEKVIEIYFHRLV